MTEADVALAGVGQDMAGRIEGLASCFLEFVCVFGHVRMTRT